MAKEFAKEFYQSDAWKRARTSYIKYRCGLCERCGGAGVIVHHKKYLTTSNINDPKVTLSFRNLELLCMDCHNKEHLAKKNTRYSFDEYGNMLPPVSKSR